MYELIQQAMDPQFIVIALTAVAAFATMVRRRYDPSYG